jgi:hypothetical protein
VNKFEIPTSDLLVELEIGDLDIVHVQVGVVENDPP